MQIPVAAATQGGCFTFRQARAEGWTYDRLEGAVLRGDLHRVRTGVWIEPVLWDALDEKGQHLVAVRAELLARKPGWYAGRRSAALAMQLPIIGKPPEVPQLVADTSTRSRSRHHKVAPLPAAHVSVRDGIPVSTLSRTTLDTARGESFLNAVVVADAVLGLGVPLTMLEEVLAFMHGWPGTVKARQVLDFADGLSETPLESLSRVRCHEHGLPAPELQVEIYRGDTFLGRADKLWRAHGVVGEDDGMGKLGDTEDERGDSLKRTYERGFRIDGTGLVVARWGWDDAWKKGGAEVRDRVLDGFARATTRTLDPDLRFVPTTVEDRLEREARRKAG